MLKNRGVGNALFVGMMTVVIALAAAGFYMVRRAPAAPRLETRYQAVLLTNGQAYFGKLEGWGTPYPVLRDVFYVQSQTNAETRQVTNVLVKRGKEWHGPDRMYLNASNVVLVEPVNPNSRVAELIRAAENH
ncbi:MAG TPA: hypothetical protein VHA11_07230 [Bryobacteraceae bacterium]|nr:hypothetical protein [Bryobacteraceae bacterium]